MISIERSEREIKAKRKEREQSKPSAKSASNQQVYVILLSTILY